MARSEPFTRAEAAFRKALWTAASHRRFVRLAGSNIGPAFLAVPHSSGREMGAAVGAA